MLFGFILFQRNTTRQAINHISSIFVCKRIFQMATGWCSCGKALSSWWESFALTAPTENWRESFSTSTTRSLACSPSRSWTTSSSTGRATTCAACWPAQSTSPTTFCGSSTKIQACCWVPSCACLWPARPVSWCPPACRLPKPRTWCSPSC